MKKLLIPFLLLFSVNVFSQTNGAYVFGQSTEHEAYFPKGDTAWSNYMRQNLNANVPVINKAPKGTYQVIVKFIVSKDGSVSDVEAETNFGYGMEQEAIRVIKNSPIWTPAFQRGHNVSSYRRQPVTFAVERPYQCLLI